MYVPNKVMRGQVERGVESRLHTVFEGKRVSVKGKSMGWRKEEKKEREHLQPEGSVKHL